MTVVVDGSPLTIDEVVAVAYGRVGAVAGDDLDARMEPACALVERVVAGNETVYGITTGFGALSNTRIQPSQASDLQSSHAGQSLKHQQMFCVALPLSGRNTFPGRNSSM